MKITKGQLKRIIREEYSRLKRRGLIKESRYGRKGLLKESSEIAAEIWADNGEGTEWGQDLLDALNRAQSSSHLQAMCQYSEELKDTMIDMDHDCEMHNVSTVAVLGWIRMNHCPKRLDGWYSEDPNKPGAFNRRWSFFDD